MSGIQDSTSENPTPENTSETRVYYPFSPEDLWATENEGPGPDGEGSEKALGNASKSPVFESDLKVNFAEASPAADFAESIPTSVLQDSHRTRYSLRSKSSQRIRYEAQVQVLKRKLGDLESIRKDLGLSQRKICQLLMVDPSAWTRWTRPGESAPPHIYRALQWYLALADKYPAVDAGFWLESVARPSDAELEDRVAKTVARVEARLKDWEAKLAAEKATEKAADSVSPSNSASSADAALAAQLEALTRSRRLNQRLLIINFLLIAGLVGLLLRFAL